MRFFEDSPSIPNELLEERDRGEVVFFCGAGVSTPAGLPSFVALTQHLIAKLGVPEDARSHRLFKLAVDNNEPAFAPPMDQIIGLLQREYGPAQVENILNQRLRTPRHASLSAHRTILRLSTDQIGRPRLVTTNFDLLFEVASPGLRRYVPPALPDLSGDQQLNGLVYLHGRLRAAQRQPDVNQELILGSADFGRAYLADAWATRFVQQLLAKYTIVLLGYSADDPPIRYLLEGLNSRPSGQPRRIYAFTEGEPGEADDRWWGRGVKVIPYPKVPERHAPLWRTLDAWAVRAQNPDDWRSAIAELSVKGPARLARHERGQVAALVETAAGARVFAEHTPRPPAEWLCAFDPFVRYAEPRQNWQNSDQALFDPQDSFGLDDDPPRATSRHPDSRLPPGRDFLVPLPSEASEVAGGRLGGITADEASPLPPRLFQLARWFSSVAGEPAAIWWAAGKGALHPSMTWLVELALQRDEIKDPTVRRAWRLYLEAMRNRPAPHSEDWYRLQEMVKVEGWSTVNLRELERVLRPSISCKRPLLSEPRPPASSEQGYRLAQLASFEVEFPTITDADWSIPDALLAQMTACLRKGLEHAAAVLADIYPYDWRTPTLHPEVAPGETIHGADDVYFLKYASSLARLTEIDPIAGKREFEALAPAEPSFLAKVRIWGSMKAALAKGPEVARYVLELPDEIFWNAYLQRELLWTLRARWFDLSTKDRREIEARISGGPPRWPDEERAAWTVRKGHRAAARLGWLQLNGCALSRSALSRLPGLRAADPQWRASWDESADHSYEGRSGRVKTDTDTEVVSGARLSHVVEAVRRAEEREFASFVQHRPFTGLVHERPSRALAALAFEARHQRYPVGLWQSLLSEWPKVSSDRLAALAVGRLAQLPLETIRDLRFYLPRWINQHLSNVSGRLADEAWSLWDRVVEALVEGGAAATASGLGDVTIGGIPQNRSRRSLEHALNSPTGPLAEFLLNRLSAVKPGEKAGIPDGIRERLEQLTQMPGEGADHALSTMTRQLRWLDYVDPDWVRRTLTPVFDPAGDAAEPAWAGYLFDNELVSASLFRALKPHFIELFGRSRDWRWEGHLADRMGHFLVVATSWGRKNKNYLSFTEALGALHSSGDAPRHAALWQLARWVEQPGAWKDFVKPFLERSWPKEERYQTAATARALAEIAIESGDNFPAGVKVVLPFLRPSDQVHGFMYRLKGGNNNGEMPLARRFPIDTIKLLDNLIPDAPNQSLYDLSSILEATAEAEPSLRQDLRWRRLRDLLI